MYYKHSEDEYTKYLKDYLNTETYRFYYSFTYDLSHSLQDNFFYSSKEKEDIKRKYEASDGPVFMWNEFIARSFETETDGLSRDKWIVRLIHGYYEEMSMDLFSNTISTHIISRRMAQNAGTRYNKRGLNSDGFVANYVETEQIVVNLTLFSSNKPLISSFVQVRGSVPLYWYQNSGYSFKPEINIRKDADDQYISSNKHFSDMMGLYGRNIFCMNLMKSREARKSNKEEILGQNYQELVEKLKKQDSHFGSIKYYHIDMKNSIKEDQDDFFNRALKMAEQLSRDYGLFMLNGFVETEGEVAIEYQNGMIRTNCVDCLDRTNFYQNLVSEIVFSKQLKSCLLMHEKESLDLNQKIVQTFQLIWKNTGDNIALQYGGSKAHQQKNRNATEVAYQSIKRYLSNAISDKNRQLQMSVFLGEYSPDAKIQDNKTYLPSEGIIEKYYSDKLFGKQQVDFSRKVHVPGSRSLSERSFIVPQKSLQVGLVEHEFKWILLMPKNFETRKNIISENTDKRIIQGLDRRDEEDFIDLLAEKAEKRKPVSRWEDAVDLGARLEEINQYNQNNLFNNFFTQFNPSECKPRKYEELKEEVYGSIWKDALGNMDYDTTGLSIVTQRLIRQYDLDNIIDHSDTGDEAPQKDEVEKERTILQPAEVLQQSNNLNEMRQILQHVPNAIKNKIKVY